MVADKIYGNRENRRLLKRKSFETPFNHWGEKPVSKIPLPDGGNKNNENETGSKAASGMPKTISVSTESNTISNKILKYGLAWD